MDARAPAPAPKAAEKPPSFFEYVGELILARRWKLLSVAAVYCVGRTCPLWPEWAQPLCELLTQILSALGAGA